MFAFKQFTVTDSQSAMKVGTDGVLLASWVELPLQCYSILDVGSGSGIISLILAQRTKGEVLIDAIEIDKGAVNDSEINFSASPWSKIFNLINGNFVSYSKECKKQYSLIVSNPPYFTENTKSPDNKRCIARNASSLSFDSLFSGVINLLSEEGIFALVLPAKAYEEIAQIALLKGLYLKRLTWVSTTPDSLHKRLLVEWSRKQIQYSIDTLIISDKDGDYTSQYKSLTEEYYL